LSRFLQDGQHDLAPSGLSLVKRRSSKSSPTMVAGPFALKRLKNPRRRERFRSRGETMRQLLTNTPRRLDNLDR
jgi:hypothetical protein